ncbi:uncharacterized protein CANTADRAFT_52263 [Suhomyces tanzawaensis NRRL Y-17324]|uniref:EF-hand n=1 Tax=Suhomyces tanzawaensis NRRL Y-17324 TaxID=984487 RepID=A0A1E4SI90_9ASCO|nr:uncharacterized protein CANTADRAFT_52263 [Suhomyces tanzawaensis NRRL Y-17324]ODV79157.1 hypothetical protein CANTADRAFT_52263 [Suhomyces tanzawaensis NRRL Y-17324]
MLALNTLSNNQKAQLRNAFTLIDGESRDSTITKQDLVNLYTQLGMAVPGDDQLTAMLTVEGGNGSGINFTQFLNIMAKEFLRFEDRMTIYNAMKVFAEAEDPKKYSEDLIIDVENLKEACCSVQLGEIGSGDNRLSRATFDRMVEGFVKEQMDGRKLLLASKWLDAYID